MKVYIGIIVDTEGFDDGTESYPLSISESRQHVLDKMYANYLSTFERCKENGELDDENAEPVSKEEFESVENEGLCALIQNYDYHIQYELMYRDVE